MLHLLHSPEVSLEHIVNVISFVDGFGEHIADIGYDTHIRGDLDIAMTFTLKNTNI